jgi:hypothetical protein
MKAFVTTLCKLVSVLLLLATLHAPHATARDPCEAAERARFYLSLVMSSCSYDCCAKAKFYLKFAQNVRGNAHSSMLIHSLMQAIKII